MLKLVKKLLSKNTQRMSKLMSKKHTRCRNCFGQLHLRKILLCMSSKFLLLKLRKINMDSFVLKFWDGLKDPEFQLDIELIAC